MILATLGLLTLIGLVICIFEKPETTEEEE